MKKLIFILLIIFFISCAEEPVYKYNYIYVEMRLVDGSIKKAKYKVPECATVGINSYKGSYNLIWRICPEKRDKRFSTDSRSSNNYRVLKSAVIDFKILKTIEYE